MTMFFCLLYVHTESMGSKGIAGKSEGGKEPVMNGIATVDLYHGVPIHRVTCGQERVYYIGQDIHTVYPDVAACRYAIDQKTCTA